MFQDHQLFPHRDVGGNVGFGLRMRGAARGAGRGSYGDRVAELLELVGLPGAQDRAVASLSGGEQQRVALARALAPSPRLLMLDEPLGQLDRGLRERLVVELRGLFARLGTTVLAVTHDQGEAFALADRVVVMRDGRIAQAGTPLEVWQRPASEFVARFLGFENVVLAGGVGRGRGHGVGQGPGVAGTPEGPQRLLVRPAGVTPGADGRGLRCEVLSRTFRGTHVALLLRPEAGPVLEAEWGLAGAAGGGGPGRGVLHAVGGGRPADGVAAARGLGPPALLPFAGRGRGRGRTRARIPTRARTRSWGAGRAERTRGSDAAWGRVPPRRVPPRRGCRTRPPPRRPSPPGRSPGPPARRDPGGTRRPATARRSRPAGRSRRPPARPWPRSPNRSAARPCAGTCRRRPPARSRTGPGRRGALRARTARSRRGSVRRLPARRRRGPTTGPPGSRPARRGDVRPPCRPR